jgi:hypothetical protein
MKIIDKSTLRLLKKILKNPTTKLESLKMSFEDEAGNKIKNYKSVYIKTHLSGTYKNT